MHIRRFIKLVFVATALGTSVASLAWACTVFKGQMTLSQTGQTSQTNVGNNSGMGYCGGASSAVMTIDDASQYTITVAPSTGNCASHLGSGLIISTTFDINKTESGAMGDCMSGDAQSIPITTFSVSASGNGTKTLNGSTVDSNTDAICVSTSSASKGNQMTVSVI